MFWEQVPRLFVLFVNFRHCVAKQSYKQKHDGMAKLHTFCYQQPALLPSYSTDITMKECAAYGGVTAHSGMEDVYENPRLIGSQSCNYS